MLVVLASSFARRSPARRAQAPAQAPTVELHISPAQAAEFDRANSLFEHKPKVQLDPQQVRSFACVLVAELTMDESYPDVDCIWDSLKSEDVCVGTNHIFNTTFPRKPARKISKSTSQRFIIKDLGRTFDFEDVSPGDLKEKSSCNDRDGQSQRNAAEDPSNLLIGIDVDGTSSVGILSGDSDDEADDANEDARPQLDSSNSWRIERVAKALGSDDASSRVLTLTRLKDAIKALLLHRPVPPRLDYASPYDDNQIKLNRNLPLVSDFVTPKVFQSAANQALKTTNGTCVTKHDESNESMGRLQTILNVCGNSLFRLVGDSKSEKCRVLSLECLNSLLLSGIDLARHIPYLIPALCARYPPCSYDKDMDVFVQDGQLHDFHKRGGATDRQDRVGLFGRTGAFQVIEPNEELRLKLCQTFECLARGLSAAGAERSLDAYCSDIILSLQTSLSDPFPEVKIEACQLLVQLLRFPHWEQGAKYFATGLARSALPNCRHRNTNVIIAALDLFEASVCVPDRAKVKGAGTAAMADIVGFREANVLPIAAFYDSQCRVSVNTLAELSSHKNHRVRLRCCKMLSYFLVYLPDRYDHQQRLLPYILSFVSDDMPEVQNAALQCIEKCGAHYECEHPDEVIERRQFGVDGDCGINYDSDLPPPFARRPSLSARLFMRANTGRFFLAVLGELSNWREHTRLRSAELLLVLAVYCEEHLTKEFQHTINSIAKAIGVEEASRCENDHWKILEKIQEVLRLMAKYVDPETYLPLISPRISGGDSSVASNPSSHAIILSSLIEGAPLLELLPHWLALATLLSGNSCIGQFAGTQTKTQSLNALLALVGRVTDKEDMATFVAHFADYDAGEQRAKLREVVSSSILRGLLNNISETGNDENAELAAKCIHCLTQINATVEECDW